MKKKRRKVQKGAERARIIYPVVGPILDASDKREYPAL
jgi:hypothetical protein